MQERIIKGIINDYKIGFPLVEITRKWNVSRWSVYYYLKKHNLPLRRPRLRKKVITTILDDYKKGLLLSKIIYCFIIY